MQTTCDNCQSVFHHKDLKPLGAVHKLGERLDPGSIVPDGECPSCGAFCYRPQPALVRDRPIEQALIWAYQQGYVFANAAAESYCKPRSLSFVSDQPRFDLMKFEPNYRQKN